VFGVIKKKGTTAPIAAAEVSVGTTKVQTNLEGKYRIEGLSAEAFIVRVLHPAYLGTAKELTPAAEHEIELDIELETADFVARVRIIDQATQQPIEGAQVTAIAYTTTFASDAEGVAYLVGLSSLNIDVRVEKAGYATATAKIPANLSEIIAGQTPPDIPLVPGARIDGVCTSKGEPLPGATRVEIWSTTKLMATLQTDTDGAYTSEALPLGQYFVGLPDYHIAAQAVTLTEEGLTHDFEIGRVCHLRGKLLRADGLPHANAGVYVYRRDEVYWTATIHTGPDGKYEVMNLFPGEWVFCALKTQGDTAAQFAVTVSVSNAGWTTKDVQLPQITGVITGRVTYPDGTPVKKARVSVTNLGANFPRALLAAYVVTNDEGYYTAERLENGAQMQARVGGYQDEAQTGTAFSEVVTVPSDSSAVEADR
jgi:hypothetical protein